MASVQSGSPERDFKQELFPDSGEWRFHGSLAHNENWACYCRGDPLRDTDALVCHGCPLSVAYRILREGFVVGAGHHSKNGTTRKGVFVVSGGWLPERVRLARNRSTTKRDTEWQHGVSGWSTPCVLAFPAGRVTTLEALGCCYKSVIEGPEGAKIRLPVDMALCLKRGEYARYTKLPALLLSGGVMMCGGKDADGCRDPLYWAYNHNMSPSCGRVFNIDDRDRASSWLLTKGANIWFCSRGCCNQQSGVERPVL